MAPAARIMTLAPRLLLCALLALWASHRGCDAIPVDNGLEGDPEVECGPSFVTVNFNTRNPFEGNVFVKTLFDNEECRSTDTGGRVAGVTLPFDTCNMVRTRSLEPRGMFISVTVIISFHPQFITKVDRAFRIQCFFMETDKTVSQELEVSMLTTAFQTQVVPMPICRYEILDGPTGEAVRYALVGEAVYHKWTCDTETTDTFCMTVHTCFVDDGNGDTVDLLDEQGCAQDRYLLRNLEYLTDLMAGQETHVFKYADRPQLFFQCQITITIKEADSECPTPTCTEPQRGKRSAALPHINADATTTDVRAELATLDLEQDRLRSDVPHHSPPLGGAPRPDPVFRQTTVREGLGGYCLSQISMGIIVSVLATLCVATVTSSLLLFNRK